MEPVLRLLVLRLRPREDATEKRNAIRACPRVVASGDSSEMLCKRGRADAVELSPKRPPAAPKVLKGDDARAIESAPLHWIRTMLVEDGTHFSDCRKTMDKVKPYIEYHMREADRRHTPRKTSPNELHEIERRISKIHPLLPPGCSVVKFYQPTREGRRREQASSRDSVSVIRLLQPCQEDEKAVRWRLYNGVGRRDGNSLMMVQGPAQKRK